MGRTPYFSLGPEKGRKSHPAEVWAPVWGMGTYVNEVRAVRNVVEVRSDINMYGVIYFRVPRTTCKILYCIAPHTREI